MFKYTFIGTVLPETTRINAAGISVNLEAGPDYPEAQINMHIVDNKVVTTCHVAVELSDVACATLKNIVQDANSSLCDAVAILQGAWTVVAIQLCLNSEGIIRMKFGNSSERLKLGFEQNGVNINDIVSINLHPNGFFFRLALDDLNIGLMEGKFMRSHFYRAIESLRRSICPPSDNLTNAQSWEIFRNTLGVTREQIELFAHHAERHGDYRNAIPLSGAEVDNALDTIAYIFGSYVRWFRANNFASTTAT